VRFLAVSLKNGRSPGFLHSTVFDDQLVLQSQLIPYEELSVSQL